MQFRDCYIITLILMKVNFYFIIGHEGTLKGTGNNRFYWQINSVAFPNNTWDFQLFPDKAQWCAKLYRAVKKYFFA